MCGLVYVFCVLLSRGFVCVLVCFVVSCVGVCVCKSESDRVYVCVCMGVGVGVDVGVGVGVHLSVYE